MKTAEDIDSYLIRMGATYDVVTENIWVVGELGADVVVSIAGPIVVFSRQADRRRSGSRFEA
jgi:hypothetical protein